MTQLSSRLCLLSINLMGHLNSLAEIKTAEETLFLLSSGRLKGLKGLRFISFISYNKHKTIQMQCT